MSDHEVLPEPVIQRVITTLNRALESDPDAISHLVAHRVSCNDRLLHDPTIQCGADPSEVGMLGIINGLCGIDSETGYGPIAAVCNDDGHITSFGRCKKARVMPGQGTQ